MRHSLVILAVICAVIGNGWAQNRGSSRYTPPEKFDEDITRAPRPTRGAAVRRQRITTKAPEPIEEEGKSLQTAESPARTTGRRVPQRSSPQQITFPLSPSLPVDDLAPRYAIPADELSPAPPAESERKQQGNRRRRPKKRRRPQNTVPKVIEETEKPITAVVSNDEKAPITDLINEDKKRNGIFQSHPSTRNSLPTYSSDSVYQHDKSQWDNKQSSEQQNNAAGSQFYEPQPAINRLPVADSEPVGNSRGYLDTSPVAPVIDAPAPYAPPSVPKDTSYVPILTPVRLPSEGSSRLPHENYPATQNKDRYQQNPNVPLRGHSNRSPVATPEEIIRAKPVLNIIPQSDEPSIPVRGHSEVRLPEDHSHISSPYASPTFDSSEDLSAPNAKIPENINDSSNPSNRLPNPSEIHYDSTYRDFPDDQSSSSQKIAGRRQEPEEPVIRNPPPSYTIPRRNFGTKPHEFDNDAEIDRRQASEYRPPLQRAGSRFKVEDKPVEKAREQVQSQPIASSRTRGSTRYQPNTADNIPERTRTRTTTDSQADSPSRSRSSSTSQSNTRTRGSQRYSPDTTRKPLVDSEETLKNTPSAGYIPLEEYMKNEERSERILSPRTHNQPLVAEKDSDQETYTIRGNFRRPQTHNLPPTSLPAEKDPDQETYSIRGTLRTRPQTHNLPSPSLPVEKDPDQDTYTLRGTLRSRPQFEVKDSDPTDRFEESVEEPNIYRPDNPYSHQPNVRARVNQAASYPNQPSLEPAYQYPPNRQQNRQELRYEKPQNYHSRHQSQHVAPPTTRTDSRQISNRPNVQNAAIQGRSRHQSENPSGSSTGRNNFKCPDAFGFFADPVQCDKYYECRNGTAEMHLCSDGLAFNEISSPKYVRCDSLRDVDCKSRPELQEPKPTRNCPRRFGLFAHETDCTKFWNCVDGVATEVQCPPGLTYNDKGATCDWADLVETTCKSEDLLGFTCPDPTGDDLQDGVYGKYAHPDNCQLHFICIKGEDGRRRPRMLSCNEGLVFDLATKSCRRPEEVPGCENFYGGRSQAPKKKPASQPAYREPEVASEEVVEEPAPRPRRRGPTRRVRS